MNIQRILLTLCYFFMLTANCMAEEKSLEAVARLVPVIGKDLRSDLFNDIAKPFGIPGIREGEAVKRILLEIKKTVKFNAFVVRLNEGKAPNYILVDGVDKEAYFFLTSTDMKFRGVYFQKAGGPIQVFHVHEVNERFLQ